MFNFCVDLLSNYWKLHRINLVQERRNTLKLRLSGSTQGIIVLPCHWHGGIGMFSFHPQPHDNHVTVSICLISYSSWSNSDTAKEINHSISVPKRDRNNVVCRASAPLLDQYFRETSKIRISLSILVREKYSQSLTFNYFPNPNEIPVSWNLKPMNTFCILFPNCVMLSVYCVLYFLSNII